MQFTIEFTSFMVGSPTFHKHGEQPSYIIFLVTEINNAIYLHFLQAGLTDDAFFTVVAISN
jgi:hypothetical protein